MRKATEKEYQLINEYFQETGWSVNSDETIVLVSDDSEEVAKYIGVDTTDMSYNQILDSLDVENVWYDGEQTHSYYVIVS